MIHKYTLTFLLIFIFSYFYPQVKIDSLFNEAEKCSNDSIKISILLKISEISLNKGDISGYKNTNFYVRNIINYSSIDKKISNLNQLKNFYLKNNLYDSVVKIYKEIADNYIARNDTVNYVDKTNLEAYYYTFLGNYKKSLSILYNNLKISESLKNSNLLQKTYMFLGFGIRNNDLNKAGEYFKKSLFYNPDSLSNNYSTCLNEIGNIYTGTGHPEKALPWLKRAMIIRQMKKDKSIVFSYNDIAFAYSAMGKYYNAVPYMLKCVEIEKLNGNNHNLAHYYSSLGYYYLMAGKLSNAERYLHLSLEIIKELKLNPLFRDVYYHLYLLNKKKNDYKKALEYYELKMFYEDTIQHNNTKEQIAEIEKKYKSEKQDAEMALMEKEKSVNEKKIKEQRLVGKIIISLFLIMSGIAFMAYRTKQKEKKANDALKMQNEEIIQQKERIEETSNSLMIANKNIAEKNKFITDNIKYAGKIQKAMLTSVAEINRIIPENFVIYKPRDIVSGDFYSVKKLDNIISFIVADCTGHGVSGAFMSILGMSLANEIILEEKVFYPSEFLNILREKVKKSLNQNKIDAETIDGMDLAMCIYDIQSKTLMYSGAQISLYIAENNEIKELKADLMPIGISFGLEKPFSMQSLKLSGNETLYLFTDGFPDQFGGEKGKKLMTSKVIQKLTEICDKPMNVQKSYIDAFLKNWQSDFPQVDDILITGFRFNNI